MDLVTAAFALTIAASNGASFYEQYQAFRSEMTAEIDLAILNNEQLDSERYHP